MTNDVMRALAHFQQRHGERKARTLCLGIVRLVRLVDSPWRNRFVLSWSDFHLSRTCATDLFETTGDEDVKKGVV